MSSFYAADDLQNFSKNIIPVSVTVTPWQCKLAEVIFRKTGDKKMKSIAGAQGWNTWIIDQMFSHYAKDPSPLYIQEKARVSKDIAEIFVKNIKAYKGQDEREGLAAGAADLAIAAAEAAKKAAENMQFILGILAVGVAGYLIFAGKKGVNFLPHIGK